MKNYRLFIFFGLACLIINCSCSESKSLELEGEPVILPQRVLHPRTESSENSGMRVRASRIKDPSGVLVRRLTFDLRDRYVSYRMPLDSENPLLPLSPAPKWKPYSPLFKIIGLNGTGGPGEWLFDWQSQSVEDSSPTEILLTRRVDAWGIVDDGTGETAIMIWADPGKSPQATLMIQDIPETDWVAFFFYTGVSNAAESKLVFENLPYTYWPSKGTLRGNAVANADGDFAYGNDGKHWKPDDVRYWALTHNIGSQQTRGACYVFHPDDFSQLTINRGRRGVQATIRPGQKMVRFALTGFGNKPWTEALKEYKPEFSRVLSYLDEYSSTAHFRPREEDFILHDRLKMILKDLRTSKIEIDAADAEVLDAFFKGFSVFEAEGLDREKMTEWLRLSNQAQQLEDPLVKLLLNKKKGEKNE